MDHFESIQITIFCHHGHGQQSHRSAGSLPRSKGDLFQKKTHPVENPVLEVDLHAPRNILNLIPMIDLGEVDANL